MNYDKIEDIMELKRKIINRNLIFYMINYFDHTESKKITWSIG